MKNFTPHDIRLVLPDRVDILPTIGVCRAVSTERCAAILDLDTDPTSEHHRGNWTAKQPPGHIVVMSKPMFTGLEWIPSEPEPGCSVVVSVVAAPVVEKHRPDLTVYVPDTGPHSVVRSSSGQIEGVRRLILWSRPLRQIEIVLPYNPSNPYDGWKYLGAFAEDDWAKAVDLASTTESAMYLVPGRQPAFARRTEEAEGEHREQAKAFLVGLEPHWGRMVKSGSGHAREGRPRDEDIPVGCWARRAYDHGYDRPTT